MSEITIGKLYSNKSAGRNKIIFEFRVIKNRVGETGLVPVSSSHTTVRTVRYTAVPCFYTVKGVFGVVFSYPPLESLLSILRIPSYSFDKEPRFRASDSPSFGNIHLLPYCKVRAFPDQLVIGYYALG